RPEIFELYRPKLRICRAQRALEPSAYPLRTWPDWSASSPQQAVTADDSVVVIGVTRIAYRPAEGGGFRKALSERLRHARERSDRNERIGKALYNRTEMNIAGQHHVTGTHTPARRLNPLAHAGEIDADSLRILEDTDAGSLSC